MYTRVLEFAGAKDIDGGVEYLRHKVVPILDAMGLRQGWGTLLGLCFGFGQKSRG